jgi:tetratricopeptide (TPR) repeat protein
VWNRAHRKPVTPTSLIASAYAEQRTFELRFQAAPYGQISRKRGDAGSVLDKPESLIQAELEIKRAVKSSPNDPVLLDAEGQAELLEGDYDGAIKRLSHALALHPQWPEALSDLAIAYTQRGDQENRPIDYGKAVDLLGQAIAVEPKNPVLLFNRAIVQEKLALLEEAQKDWNSFLQLDSTSGWAGEARRHLDSIQKKLRHSMAEPHTRDDLPGALFELRGMLASSRSDHGSSDSRDEDYLDLAIIDWMPDLAKRQLSRLPSKDLMTWDAVTTLAAVLSARHHDNWLKDALGLPLSNQRAHGWVELGLAARANLEGNYTSAATAANNAQSAFRNPSDGAFLLSVWEQPTPCNAVKMEPRVSMIRRQPSIYSGSKSIPGFPFSFSTSAVFAQRC